MGGGGGERLGGQGMRVQAHLPAHTASDLWDVGGGGGGGGRTSV